MQSRGRMHVHGHKGRHTLQQWHLPQYLTNNLSSHVIRGGGRIGCPFHQCENSHLDAPNACETWTPITMHTNANRQRNSTCATHQQNITKSTQSHGYVFPLAKMPQCTGPNLLLLETRHTELGRLFHQASPNQPPQICPPHNTNTRQQSQIHKTLETTTTPVTFEPQLKTLVSRKLFVKNLLQTPRFKTMTINTVTAKSA